jgi:lysophospholipase L1-like esterase
LESTNSDIGFDLRYVVERAVLVTFGLVVALLLAEAVLRIFPPPNRFTLQRLLEQQWEPDDELLLRLKPHLNMKISGHPEFSYTVQTNSDGLRDEPFVGDSAIAALGDSFTFGFGVEEDECWPSQLEALGNRRVANLGWAGWNSFVYPAAIRRYAIPLKTDVWLWAFFVNDLPESAGAEDFLNSGERDYLSWVQTVGQSAGELRFPQTLRIVQFVAAILDPELFLLPDSGDRVFEHRELRMRVGRYAWQVTDPNDPDVQRGWVLTERALREANDLARAHDATLVVIFVPCREHVYWPYVKGMLKDVDVAQLDDVETSLAALCRELDVAYLNLLPGFRSGAQDKRMLYFPSDGHWNEAGHELAAQLIYEFLLDEGLIEP